MPKYKHNDYYGYINSISTKAIQNPEWFWSDAEDATQVRQWLYNNGAKDVVDDIYNNTPSEIQSKIDKKKLDKNKLPNTPLIAQVESSKTNPATISQGYKQIGSKDNNHRVNQKSLFGEREYNSNPSLAQRFGNWITDGLHLTSPPTFKDGYGRTLNAEVPTWESAQGQELKRMGETAMKGATLAAIPFGLHQLYVNPLSMSAAIGSGFGIDQVVKVSLNSINDKLKETGKQLSENQQNAIRGILGLSYGNSAYKWGNNVTKRGLEVAMHTTGAVNPMRQIQEGWKARNWKQRKNVIDYILTGKNKNGTSNTLNDEFQFYTGLSGAYPEPTLEYGYDAVRTYLYGEPLVSFKPVQNPDLGAHAKYVAKNYPGKKIKVYEANQDLYSGNFRPSQEPTLFKTEGEMGPIDNITPQGRLESFDAAGHILETGLLDGDFFTRHQDIWKFNSKDYMDKWLSNNEGLGILRKLPLKWGLDIVDYHGTPFIVRSPWQSTRTIRPTEFTGSVPLKIPMVYSDKTFAIPMDTDMTIKLIDDIP